MTSCDWSNFRLSWTPLIPGQRPQFDTIRYFNKAQNAWTDYVDSSPGYQIFSPASPWDAENPYAPAKIYEPHVCASWVEKPGCWIAIYTHAGQDPNAELPVVARFSVDLFNWSDEVAIFDPRRENAYGRWMHDPNDPNDHIVGYPGSVDNVKGFGYGSLSHQPIHHLRRHQPHIEPGLRAIAVIALPSTSDGDGHISARSDSATDHANTPGHVTVMV